MLETDPTPGHDGVIGLSPGQGSSRADPGRPGPRLLLVDPDLPSRSDVRALLADRGCIIIGETGSGRRAEEMARWLVPDVVLIELELADGGGLETAYRLRLWDPDIQVIALTKRGRLPPMGSCWVGLYLAGFVWKNDTEALLTAVRRASRSL